MTPSACVFRSCSMTTQTLFCTKTYWTVSCTCAHPPCCISSPTTSTTAPWNTSSKEFWIIRRWGWWKWLWVVVVFVSVLEWGAGMAQWLECQTRDWKVAGSNHCRSSRWIFSSRINFLYWLLFLYLFHPRVTALSEWCSVTHFMGLVTYQGKKKEIEAGLFEPFWIKTPMLYLTICMFPSFSDSVLLD